jgi:HEAT repeat protein
MAIWALARIPTREAALALLAPLIKADPATQVLLLSALATNEKTSEIQGAVGTFHDLARGGDERVRAMSIELLGTMPYSNTLRALQPLVENNVPGALRATLALARRLLDAGKPQEAEQALGLVTGREGLSVPVVCEMLYLQGRLDTDGARESVFKAIYSENPRIRAAALDACVALSGPRATAAIGLLMAETEDRNLKIGLLHVLGQRGDTMADTAAALIKAAATHEDDDVKIAAIQAIEEAQLVAPAVSTLILLLDREDGPVRDQAAGALYHLKSEAVGTWIIRALPEASPSTKATLLRVLAKRGEAAAIPVVLDAAESDDGDVRVAAYEAIGQLRAAEGFDLLMKAFREEKGAALATAEQAMLQLADENVTRRLLEVYTDSDASQKPSLLRVLGQRQAPDVARLLSDEIGNDNPAIRAAALANIGRHDRAIGFDALVAEAKRGPEIVTRNAVASMLELARRSEEKDKAKALDMYAASLKHAVDDDQRREALEGLTRTLDPKRDDLLAQITPFMDRETLAAPAARVAAKIAIELPESRKAEAVEVLRKVVRIQPDEKTTLQSIRRVRQLGEEIDPAREAGFITSWWLIGPYPNPENKMWDIAYRPEEKIDLEAMEEVAGQKLTWKKHRTPHLQGIVNLQEAVANKNEVGAYACAEINVKDEQVVEFKMGSDDSIVLWVNGDKVHANRINRGVTIDDDVARAKLKPGRNRILAKILQGAHAWEFVIRVTDLEGKPVEFTQE